MHDFTIQSGDVAPLAGHHHHDLLLGDCALVQVENLKKNG